MKPITATTETTIADNRGRIEAGRRAPHADRVLVLLPVAEAQQRDHHTERDQGQADQAPSAGEVEWWEQLGDREPGRHETERGADPREEGALVRVRKANVGIDAVVAFLAGGHAVILVCRGR